MGFNRRQEGRLDPWPVVADAFLGILAVFVIIIAAREVRAVRSPKDRESMQFQEELRDLHNRFPGLLDAEPEIDENEGKFVFSVTSLSFDNCSWDIPVDKQGEIHKLFRAIGHDWRRTLIREIRIEGHADKRPLNGVNCPGVVPFLDNLQLSQNRARAVYNVVLGLRPTQTLGLQKILDKTSEVGPPPGLEYLRELNHEGKLLVAGFGDRLPREADRPESLKNRRVEIVIQFRKKQASQPRPEIPSNDWPGPFGP